MLLAEPARVRAFLYPDEENEENDPRVVVLHPDPGVRGFVRRLLGQPPRSFDQVVEQVEALAAEPPPPRDEPYEPREDELDIDKAWHGLHFLLTGTEWGGEPPLDFIASGGREVGDEDVGYGPARALTSAQVREIAAALEPITPEELATRFDPERMMKLDIYPGIWDRDPEEDTLGYLLEYFAALTAFVRRGADADCGMLVYLN